MGRNNEDFRGTCEDCGGSGTETIVHGDTSFSGDDDCPTCDGTGKGIK